MIEVFIIKQLINLVNIGQLSAVCILYTINIIVTDMIPRTAYVCAMHIVHVSVCVYVHMCVCVRVCVCTRRDAHCTLSRV